MMRILVVVAIVCTMIFGCKKSTEPEQEANPLVGTWILGLITDELDNYVGGSRGIDGVIVRMDLDENGSGTAYVLNGEQALTYDCSWSTGNDQFVINVQGRGELTHQYEISVGGKQSQDEAPPGASLILTGSNQFATYLEISLVLYYIKN